MTNTATPQKEETPKGLMNVIAASSVGTLIEWYGTQLSSNSHTRTRGTDFSADVSPAVIKFESKAIAETLVDIRKALVHAARPSRFVF